MKLTYISLGNVPSKVANSIQVAKMAEAFSQRVGHFELVTVGDVWSKVKRNTFDFQEWYGLDHTFRINRLPLLLKTSYPFPQDYHNRYFPHWAALYAKLRFPDVVHCRHIEAARIALRLGLSVSLDVDDPVRKRLFEEEPFVQGKFLGAVSVSQELTQQCVENGLPRKQVLLAYNGVDEKHLHIDISKASARKKFNLPRDAKIAMYAGHLYNDRGIENIFAVAKRMPRVLFLLIGGWQNDVHRRKLEIKEQHLRNVRLEGFVPNAQVPLYLSASDVLLMPYSPHLYSAAYMCPMKMFDYMAAKRAILGTDLPAVRQVMQNERNAILVPPDNAQALHKGLEMLLRDKSLMNRLASQAYQDVQNYTWDRRAARILDFIENRLAETSDTTFTLSRAVQYYCRRRLGQWARHKVT
jgi:glycosyltransferase involved in cell wall biosynthesis